MIESIEAPQQPSEADIMDGLRASGLQVAHLKVQIAALQRELENEVASVANLYRQYSATNQSLADTASAIIKSSSICSHEWAEPINGKRKCVHCGNTKRDKRTENNPIKNLNIGVNLSYRHSLTHGYNADDARERAYRSIVETAMTPNERTGVLIHSSECECEGETQHCTAETKRYVTSIQDLPKKVVAKIELGHSGYGQDKKKKVKKAKKAA